MTTIVLSDDQVLALRLRSQGLARGARDAAPTVAQVVARASGLQAQELAAGVLSVRPRSRGLSAHDVTRARLEERSIVWTWAMRGTLHLVPAEDIGWLTALLGPVFIAGARRRYLQLGLDEEKSTAGLRALRDVLAERGPQTRDEIMRALRARGIALEGQARIHLIGRAALEGLVCRGPERGREPTYVLLADWLKSEPALSREIALGLLARRYLAAYAPAAPEDFAAWSGLTRREARAGWQALAGDAIEVEWNGRPLWLPKAHSRRLQAAPAPETRVSLLPRWDTYLLGWASRDLVLAPQQAARVLTGGVLPAMLVVDGRARATWSLARHGARADLTVAPFDGLGRELHAALAREAQDVGRFLGLEVRLQD